MKSAQAKDLVRCRNLGGSGREQGLGLRGGVKVEGEIMVSIEGSEKMMKWRPGRR